MLGYWDTLFFLTTSSKVVFFAKIEPYLVMFWMSLMHKQKPNSKNVLLLLIHITGVLFLSMGDFKPIGREQYGDLLMLGALISRQHRPAVNK